MDVGYLSDCVKIISKSRSRRIVIYRKNINGKLILIEPLVQGFQCDALFFLIKDQNPVRVLSESEVQSDRDL